MWIQKRFLWKFADTLYEKFNYDQPFEQQLDLREYIDSIAKKTKAIISTVATNYDKLIGKHVEQHCKLKKKSEREEFRPRAFDPIAAVRVDGSLKITDPQYPNHSEKYLASDVMNCQGLTKRLYLASAQIQTATNSGTELGGEFLKPIDTFNIIMRKGKKPFAQVNINEHTSTHVQDLKDCPKDLVLTHTSFIASSAGHIIQVGKVALAPDPKEIADILSSEWFLDLQIDAKLLRGQIPIKGLELDRLISRIVQWPEPGFKDFFLRVAKSQPNPETVNVEATFNFLDEKIHAYKVKSSSMNINILEL